MDSCDDILVSVIIPIYNVEKYVEKCLDSVLGQTFTNLEIICVNDGTPDGSMEIVEEKAKADKRIVIVNQENGGLSKARNTGIQKASGKYIYFLDSDDWIVEDAVERLVACAEENGAEIVCFNAESEFENAELAQKEASYAEYYKRKRQYSGVYTGQQLFTEMVRAWDFKPSPWLLFIKREFLREIALYFYPGIVHEDNLFTVQLLFKAERVVYMDAILYKRLVREASIMTGEKKLKKAYGFFICHREILSYVDQGSYSLEFFRALKKYLNNMRTLGIIGICQMEFSDIWEESLRCYPEHHAAFMEYIYDLYFKYHEEHVPKRKKGKKSLSIALNPKWKRRLKKLANRFKKIKNKIIWKIPSPIRWYVRTIKRFGFGYFIYRKRIKKNPEKLCVSVVMPVYNVERYLAQALESLLCQKLPNIEIICVDDESTDNSKMILQKYEKKDSRIKVLYQEKSGAGAARNLGMSVAKGEYLLFLDADDIFDENLCNEVYYQCIRRKADVCLFGAKRINMQTFEEEPMGWVLRKNEIPAQNIFSSRGIRDKIFQITTGCPWSKMFRREFIVQTGLQFQNLPNTNDAFFVRMAMVLADKITTVDRCFVTYRYNEGNNTQSNKAKAPLAFYEAFKAMKLEMQRRNVYEMFERSYLNMVISESLFNMHTAGTEEAGEIVRKMLVDEGLEFYGFYEHKENYFYNKKTYGEILGLKEEQI